MKLSDFGNLSLLFTLLLPLLSGLVLGAFFYGGLWWTVAKGARSSRPVVWFLVSLLLRMSFVLAGIYYTTDGQWLRLAACMTGLICARLLVFRFVRQWQPDTSLASAEPPQESSHAS